MSKATFQAGLAAGIVSGMRFPMVVERKEAKWFLYNGVRLPKLPEWDKETYPYAVILQGKNTGRILFEVSTDPKAVSVVGNSVVFPSERLYEFKDGSWNGNGVNGELQATPIWANHDICYAAGVEEIGGTVFLAASVPVPVYE